MHAAPRKRLRNGFVPVDRAPEKRHGLDSIKRVVVLAFISYAVVGASHLRGLSSAAAMSDHPRSHPVKPERPDGPPPVPVSPHLLTWWFGLMAAGGVGFGLYTDERPFGNGVLAHPLVVFLACAVAGLLTLRFLHARPVLQLISARCLAVGVAIGIACFFIGTWFGVHLIHLP
jgi:hypothetical protein